MPTAAAFLPRALLFPRPRPPPPPPPPPLPPLSLSTTVKVFQQSPFPRYGSSKPRLLVLVASSSRDPFREIDSEGRSTKRLSKKSILSNLVQEIEPLDVILIQKDVPANTVDAMKRTISGMLGLLPSDQFNVLVEALWKPLFKLLISSMKTGYTLRNAEYRLCLERNLDIHEEHIEKEKEETVEDDSPELLFDRSPITSNSPGWNDAHCNYEKNDEALGESMDINCLGELTPEIQEYIFFLQSHLNYTEKELHDIKGRNSTLQMKQLVGEEKNDLLDYLRSLQPEKVSELSEPTCPGVEEIIHSVVHGLLATLSLKMYSKPPQSENPTGGTIGVEIIDSAELVEKTSMQFQPRISIPREYLARLVFWCMLLGHYIRGIESRLELMELMTVSSEAEIAPKDGDSVV